MYTLFNTSSVTYTFLFVESYATPVGVDPEGSVTVETPFVESLITETVFVPEFATYMFVSAESNAIPVGLVKPKMVANRVLEVPLMTETVFDT